MTKIKTTLKTPSLLSAQEKRLVQAEIDTELFEAVQRELKRRKLKIREAVEFGLAAFLMTHNADEAKKIGLKDCA